jgi:hypothetical protein
MTGRRAARARVDYDGAPGREVRFRINGRTSAMRTPASPKLGITLQIADTAGALEPEEARRLFNSLRLNWCAVY